MADTIDELQIKVNAEASKANDAIDKLVGKLDRLTTSLGNIEGSHLTGLANGVQRLGNAMQVMNNIKTSDFTRLANNLQKLGNINVSSLNSSASSISNLTRVFNSLGAVSTNAISIGDLAKNISKLGNKSVQTAIANIPQLGVALNSLMTTLSKAPSVSYNLIQMTNALANLSAQGSRIKTASNLMVNGFEKTSNSAEKTKTSFNGLASAFGKFYASYFMIIRGLKKLWGSIESSMDYIETLNYFEAGFGQIAQNANLSQFSELGYRSAEEYYNSFSKRAAELTSKMSGFQINSDGTLDANSSGKSLGINPERLLNYQAMFGQMSSSIGVTSETALKLSDALTMIGADLASVKNMDFDKVWTDMASGLAGMSRTLDKYGVNIRNVNLQQELTNLGIQANIQNLNQNEKALLRATILLNSTKYAWGDLANTLNLPANQLRLLSANFQNLGRSIGNLFLPILQRVLPVVNGLVIALQRLVSWVGNLLGIDIGKITSSVGSGADNISDLLDSSEGVSDSLDKAATNAKKLKNATLGIDELNIISQDDASGSGVSGSSGSGIGNGLLDDAFLDAFSKYKNAWDKAFAGMENKANEFADKIEKALEPIQKIVMDFAVGDFYQAGQDVSKLVVGITDFFADAIDKVDWYGIGRKIGDFLAGIEWIKIFASLGNVIFQALKGAFELAIGMFDSAPLETTIIGLIALPKLFKAITSTKLVSGFINMGKAIKLMFSALNGSEASLVALYNISPKLSSAIKVATKAMANFRYGIENGNWITGFNEGLSTIRNNLTKLQKGAIVAVAGIGELIATRSALKGLVDGSKDVVSAVLEIGTSAGIASLAMYTALGPAGLAISGITALVGGIIGIGEALADIDAERTSEIMKDALSAPGGVSIEDLSNNFKSALQEAASGFDAINEKASGLDDVQKQIDDTWLEIESVEHSMNVGVMSVEEGKEKLEDLFSQLATITEEKFSVINDTVLSALGENGSFRQYFEAAGVDVNEAINSMFEYNEKIAERAKEIVEELATVDVGTDRYKELKTELASLMTTEDSLAQATSTFTSKMNSLEVDYSGIVGEDGTFDEDKLKKYLSEVSDALKEYENSVDEAGAEIDAYYRNIYNSALSTPEEKAQAKAVLDALPDAMQQAKDKVRTQAKDYTNTLQKSYIDKVNKVIEDAGKDWENLNWYEKIFHPSKDEYIKEKVAEFKENADVLSDAISDSFEELGIEGAGTASEAAQKIYDSLFDTQQNYSGAPTTTLKENYKEILNDILNEMPSEAKAVGATIGTSFASGIESSTPEAEKTAQNLASNVKNHINDENVGLSSVAKDATRNGANVVVGFNKGISESGSSSVAQTKSWTDKVRNHVNDENIGIASIKGDTKKQGKGTVIAYNNGIIASKDSSKAQAFSWMRTVKDAISNSPMEFSSRTPIAWLFGRDTVEGFNKGISENQESSKPYINKWMNGVVTAIHDGALQFGSPSRKAWQFGLDTILGYNNGVLDNTKKTLSVMDTFSNEIVQVLSDTVSPFENVGFNLASYTMKGFENGLNLLYEPAINSLHAIDSNIGLAPMTGQFEYSYKPISVDNSRNEMVTQVKDAVKEVVKEFLEPYLSDIAENTRETADKNMTVAIGDKEIYKASIRGARTAGKLIVT